MSKPKLSEVVRSICGLCPRGCGVLVHLGNGKVVKVEGDPESPVNKGTLCSKGLASLEVLYHPDRLKHPLKRVGKRGDGKWQQISWDEALDRVAGELIKARDNYGAESVAFIKGALRGIQDGCLFRLANTFGTPHFVTQDHVCYEPSQFAAEVTCGYLPTPDYEQSPACIIVWASNQAGTSITQYEQILKALDKGAKLIVIDPRETELVSKADLWLRVRPASDLTLALGMTNVIINEELYDKTFVDKWTVGFDKLWEHVHQYTPEKVADITWTPADMIRRAARLYATTKPATIPWGNGIEHNVNGFQAARAIAILRAITGNLDVPGGEIQRSPTGIPAWISPQLTLVNELPADKWERRVDADLKFVPAFSPLSMLVPQRIVKAILEGDPYPIHAAYIQSANVLLTYSNAQETYRALNKLDFLAVADIFMTPTAGLADIVLPAATYLEFENIRMPSFHPDARAMSQLTPKVVEVAECRSDLEILNELAKKLGLEKYFWDDTESLLDDLLKPTGLTVEEFRKVRVIEGGKQYRKYEIDGFKTPSGKVELYSNQLKEWGFDPLPTYYEPPETPYSDPQLAREYPLIFTTYKVEPYRHSGGRQIASLRGSHPDPIISIHPQTAGKLGIAEGDWVYVETKRGRIKQKASLTTSLDPRVVVADYGWWFPEKGVAELYGWAESNINVLTDDKPPYGREVGATNLRGILCKVYKA
jgi:anaerobic selenocysteine-containing dehydrogenase